MASMSRRKFVAFNLTGFSTRFVLLVIRPIRMQETLFISICPGLLLHVEQSIFHLPVLDTLLKGPRLNFDLFFAVFFFRASWQAQYFVDLAMHISWQVQDFVDVEVQNWWQVQDFVGLGLGVQISWQAQYFLWTLKCRFRGRCSTLWMLDCR